MFWMAMVSKLGSPVFPFETAMYSMWRCTPVVSTNLNADAGIVKLLMTGMKLFWMVMLTPLNALSGNKSVQPLLLDENSATILTAVSSETDWSLVFTLSPPGLDQKPPVLLPPPTSFHSSLAWSTLALQPVDLSM